MKGLQFKEFDSREELRDWANSKDGTEYIISIQYCLNIWIIWFIVQ